MLNRIAFAQATLSVMQATRGSLVIDVRRFVVGCRLCYGPLNSDWKLTGNIDAATLVDVFLYREIIMSQLFIVEDLFSRSIKHDRARIHNDGAVGKF
jgi:hypothetical protein